MTLLRILTLALTALVLVPSAAHLFELPGKIGLERDPYFVVQGIYAGCSPSRSLPRSCATSRCSRWSGRGRRGRRSGRSSRQR